MTNEEVIKALKEVLKEDRETYQDFFINQGYADDGEIKRGLLALDKVIEDLEKQIPKKPTFGGKGFDGNGNITYDTWICPCCGEEYEVDCYYNDYKYCPWCGQMIDWRYFK